MKRLMLPILAGIATGLLVSAYDPPLLVGLGIIIVMGLIVGVLLEVL